jgi:transcriptional regulator with XRE-family HTH domain
MNDPSSDLQNLSSKLKQLRQQANLTLDALSEMSGVSASLLSQLERGIGNPSYFTLAKIASGLGVPLSRFFQGAEIDSDPVVRKHERKRLVFQDRGLVYELLTPDLNRSIEFVWCEIPPGFSSEAQPFQHEGEECVLVLQGLLEVSHGDGRTYVLEAGDSIWRRSEVPHWYRNLGKETVICVSAITPPAF